MPPFLTRISVLIRRPVLNAGYVAWAVRTGDWSFAGYYAGKTLRTLAGGGVHSTLGRHPRAGEARPAEVGRTVARLRRWGLRPGHLCVEYGCGSLRLAEQLMPALAPGGYVGLDVTDAFFRPGLQRIAAETLARFRPELAVIDADSLARVARRRPDFVVCALVLHHVPPFELGAFFDRLLSLVGPSTALVLEARLLPRRRQTRKAYWLHAWADVERALDARDCTIEAVEVDLRPPPAATRYWLRIRRKGVVSRAAAMP